MQTAAATPAADPASTHAPTSAHANAPASAHANAPASAHAWSDGGAASHIPQPRSPGLDLQEPVPLHWFAGSAVATHTANGVNMLFPAGERFFVRSVNHYLDRIQDPTLRAQVKGFFGQEGRHAKEHERVNQMLVEQGFDVAPFLRRFEQIAFGFVEKIAPASLCLATTAACEHYTAIMAENALRLGVLDAAHPTMRALLLWHAAEEIEHRAVAFDVLREVNPSYALRLGGLALATLGLAGFWVAGTVTLLRQDKSANRARLRTEWRTMQERRKGAPVFAKGIREYLRRDFHPSHKQTDQLAADYLARAGLA